MIARIRHWFAAGIVGRALFSLVNVVRNDERGYWAGRIVLHHHVFDFEAKVTRSKESSRVRFYLDVPEAVCLDDLAMSEASLEAREAYWRSLPRHFADAGLLVPLDHPVLVVKSEEQDLDSAVRSAIRTLARELWTLRRLRRTMPWQLRLETLYYLHSVSDEECDDEDLDAPPDSMFGEADCGDGCDDPSRVASASGTARVG
jgi:hypothetical protein